MKLATKEERARRVLALARDDDREQLLADPDEIPVAVEWFLQNDRATAARLVGDLRGYWLDEGRVVEGLWLTERVAEATIAEAARDPEVAQTVPRALLAASELALRQGDEAAAAKRANDAIRAAGLIDDRETAARARQIRDQAGFESPKLVGLESLLEAPSPATLTTFDADGGVDATPVWFRYGDGAFEVVIVDSDAKLANLRRDPRFIFMVFEVAPPFRRIEVRGNAQIRQGDVTEARASISGRYLGPDAGRRFAEDRRDTPSALVRLAGKTRTWHLRT